MKECANLQTGERLGDYTIVRLLGKGSMGAVYLVHDESGLSLAAKVMVLPDGDARREWRRRFVKEAGFAMTVHHKNLVAVHDMGVVGTTGLCYIIMDYMPGGTLSDLLKRKGRLGVREAVDIAIAIASVLEVAHGVGAVHRDIKPDNILFDADGTPKLTDMGIAKFGGAYGSTTVTATGVIVGTPAYMAPEQMMDSHSVDARADIYSLGLVLYEMLTGKRPHADSTVVELIAKALKGEELPDIRTIRPEVSVALSYVLSLMVAVKPEERITSAMEAAKMLYDAATDNLVMKRRSARPSTTTGSGRVRGTRWGVKAVVAWAISGLMLISAIAVGTWWMNKLKNQEGLLPMQESLQQNGFDVVSGHHAGESESRMNKPENPERLLRMKESLQQRGFDVVFGRHVGEPGSWKVNCVALEYDKDYRTITVQAKVYSPGLQAKILEYLKSENYWLVVDQSDKVKLDNEKQINCNVQIVVDKPIVRLSVAYMAIGKSDLNKIGKLQINPDDGQFHLSGTFDKLRDLIHGSNARNVANIAAPLDVITSFFAKNGISRISGASYSLMESWGKDRVTFRSGGTRFVKDSGSDSARLREIPYGFTINATGGMVDVSTISLDFNFKFSSIISTDGETYDLKEDCSMQKINCPIGRTMLVRAFTDIVDKNTSPSELSFFRSTPLLSWFVADSGKEVSDRKLVIMIYPEIMDSTKDANPDVFKEIDIGVPDQASQTHD